MIYIFISQAAPCKPKRACASTRAFTYAGWFSQRTEEYENKVYLIIYTKSDENRNYYIDVVKEFTREDC
jgi:hypothetical protein